MPAAEPARTGQPRNADIVVLGAGIAGLYAAQQLAASGFRVTVIEKSPHAGGTHRSRTIGDYTFDVGSIFYEENARLFELAPGLKDLCSQVERVQRRLDPSGVLRHYPLEPRDIRSLPLPVLARGLADLIWSRAAVQRDGTLDAISRQRLGATFFEHTGLRSYITRFHHLPPSAIDEAFFFKRMAFIERFTRLDSLFQSTLRSLTSRKAINEATRRPMRVRPREGFGRLFNPIIADLSRSGVEFALSESAERIVRDGALFRIATSCGIRTASAVVCTAPIDSVHKALFGCSSDLASLDMTTLFVSAARLHPKAGNVLFNFHGDGQWKRATIYSRIYPEPASPREFLGVEITIPQGGSHDPDSAFHDFAGHLSRLGLAEGLVLEGSEHVEACYPIYAPGALNLHQSALSRIEAAGVILAGRQGRFEYLPTSSGVIRQVGEVLTKASLPTLASELAA